MLLAPVSMHKVLWKAFQGFDVVVLATAAIPVYNVAWPCLCRDVEDNTLDGVLLHVFLVLYFGRMLVTCLFRFDSSWWWLIRDISCATRVTWLIQTEFSKPSRRILRNSAPTHNKRYGPCFFASGLNTSRCPRVWQRSFLGVACRQIRNPLAHIFILSGSS